MKRFGLVLALIMVAIPLWAGVPGVINFQGRLYNTTDGTALTGSHDLLFKIFNAKVGGTPLWQESHPGVAITNGVFSVLLGSVTSFPEGLFDGTNPLWITEAVDNGAEFPRQRLVSVAFALHAGIADTAASAQTASALDCRNCVDTGQLTAGVNGSLASIATNSGSISTLSGKVSANTGDISTLSGKVSANTGDISTLSGKVDANTTNIRTNTTSISTNTSNIDQNATDIESNTTNIGANTSDISTLSGKVSANTTNIGQNATNIGQNTGNITTNTNDISILSGKVGTNTTKIGANTSDISTLSGKVSANTTNIGQNATNIRNNTIDITANTSKITTNSGLITANAGNITTNSGLITANAGKITTNSGLITTNAGKITTNSGLITANTSKITTNSGLITANAGNITTNSGLITTNISDISTLQGTVSTNTGQITKNTSDIAALQDNGFSDLFQHLILNSGFEQGMQDWVAQDTCNSFALVTTGGHAGNKSVEVSNVMGNSNSCDTRLLMNKYKIQAKVGEKITLSFWIKSTSDSYNGQTATIDLVKANNSGTFQSVKVITLDKTGVWKEITYSFTVPTDGTITQLAFGLLFPKDAVRNYTAQLDQFDAISDKATWYREQNYAGAVYPNGPAMDLECPGCVGNSDLADGAVTTAKIANLAITNPKLADGAVDSRVIADGTIMDADISPSAAIAPSKVKDTAAVLNSGLDQNFNSSTMVVGSYSVEVNYYNSNYPPLASLNVGSAYNPYGLFVEGNTGITGTLEVTGDTTLSLDLSVVKDLKVGGKATVTGNIQTTGGKVIFPLSKVTFTNCSGSYYSKTCPIAGSPSFCALSSYAHNGGLAQSSCIVNLSGGAWEITADYADCTAVCF